MSKIPQGEWSAIAARYAKGEAISRIAQSYGCTPPAIHYILKRSKQRAAQNPQQEANGSAKFAHLAEPQIENYAVRGSAQDEIGPTKAQPAEPRTVHQPVTPMPGEHSQPTFPRQATNRTPALSAGLDSELHGRAEAAIAAFRSSFDAALAEGSPIVRQRLRQAASDLMRVAARTTIVLDRLNARAEHQPERLPDRWRWTEGR